jgi:uncharacterized membrane protein
MFAKLSIPLLALAVTLGLAATPAEAGRGGGAHVGHVGGHGYHAHGFAGHGYHGGWGGGGFYSPFWCPYPPYYGCLP